MSSESTSKVTVNWWLANTADISLKSAFIGGGKIILYDFFYDVYYSHHNSHAMFVSMGCIISIPNQYQWY